MGGAEKLISQKVRVQLWPLEAGVERKEIEGTDSRFLKSTLTVQSDYIQLFQRNHKSLTFLSTKRWQLFEVIET